MQFNTFKIVLDVQSVPHQNVKVYCTRMHKVERMLNITNITKHMQKLQSTHFVISHANIPAPGRPKPYIDSSQECNSWLGPQ